MPEANFDSIVGPTHNYAGLSPGNVASTAHRGEISRPRDAALQGLSKMRSLAGLGLRQGWLPPQERPDLDTLRTLGFSGSDAEIVGRASREAPHLLARASSASSMWAANAATVSAGDDTADGRVHFSVANLRTMLHRAIEAPQTERTLRAVFGDESRFAIHPALPGADLLGDEGAANHTRLHRVTADPDGTPGVDLFVHGTCEGDSSPPRRHPARQTREAFEAIARRHGLDPRRVVHAKQRPAAIDAGVFHNDVIAVGQGPVLLHHEEAFEDEEAVLSSIRRVLGESFVSIRIQSTELSLPQTVRSYLFNSQLVTTPSGQRLLIAPQESHDDAPVRGCIDRLIADPAIPIDGVRYFDLRESMRNGGGPACLRLRVPLREDEWNAVAAGCRFDDSRCDQLEEWVRRRYRETIAPSDLADPQLLVESRDALDELTRLLGIGSIYPFQR
jgi:succinylarginine dihydrolase